MLRDLKSSVVAVIVLTAVFGLALPALFTGFAQVAFKHQANGSLIKVNGKLVVSTDAGVFISSVQHPKRYSRFGSGLPNAIPGDMTLAPDRSFILVSSHGRGMWKIKAP